MGRQWNTIIESLGPLTGGTMSINANLTEIEALLTTLQADVADGITVSSGTVTANLLAQKQIATAAPTSAVLAGIKFDDDGTIQPISSAYPVPTYLPLESSGIGASQPNNAIQVGFETGGNYVAAGSTFPFPVTGTVTIGSLPAISGTVTATPTRGTTTTGTLTAGTTNGTLFSSSTSRNYLLVQCTSGTAFIDTNGTATTTGGIQLTSGQGITWEGSFIPTGAIAAITSTGTAQLIGRQG